MDKKTIIVVIVCVLALVAWQKVVELLYPPLPKRPHPLAAATAAATNQPAAVVAAPASPAAPPTTPTPAPVEPSAPRPPEQLLALTNDLVRVTFTSWGGGIRAIELHDYDATATNHVVLNAESPVPALALLGMAGADTNGIYRLESPGPDRVTLQGRAADGTVVTKQFVLGKGYALDGTIKVRRPPGAPAAPPGIDVVVGMASPANPRETPNYLGVDWLVDTKYHNHGLKQAEKGPQRETVTARWAAVKSQFFTMILTPASNTVAISYEKITLPTPPEWTSKKPPEGLQAAAVLAPTGRPPDGTELFQFTYYAGPKEQGRLAALGQGQEEVMQFGALSVISIVLLRSMNFFYSLIPNYGVAIILITIVIKILFWPVQAKSIRSMKEMQKFQPLMQKLREKFKDDPQRMQQEMMKLYKEHKINPFAGCLPMLVQIPVFWAFYTMLRSAIELRGAHFLWIHDLSQPDTIAHLAGFALNPLPLVMGVTMVWQMKLSPSGGDPKQQQMMMFMPLVFLFMCYNLASGLVLYWTVQQLLSIGQQWWSLRQAPPAPASGAPRIAGQTK